MLNPRHHPTREQNDEERHRFVVEHASRFKYGDLRRLRVTEGASDKTQRGNETDEDGKENGETPAGADAARADEGPLEGPSEERMRRWL